MFWLPKIRILTIGLFGLILFATNIYKSLNCGQLSGCMDAYWTNFWLISFDDGYRRRALLGHLTGLFSGGLLDFRSLNAVGFLFATAAPALIFLKYFLVRTHHPNWYWVFLILVVGPTTTVFFETAGDPLHVVFALCIFYAFVAKYISAGSSAIIAGVLSILAIMIHEAALFIFLPTIYLLHCFSHNKLTSWTFLFAALVTVGGTFVLVLNNQPLIESRAGLLLKDSSVYHAPQDALPSYKVLLQREFDAYFGSLYDFLIMIRKTIGSFAFPILGLVLVTKFMKDENFIACFLCLLLLSLPLLVIAHDWGRFLIYDFLLAMLISSEMRRRDGLFRHKLQTLYDQVIRKVASIEILICALPLISVLYSAHSNYRIFGLRPDNVMPFCLALFLMVLYSKQERIKP